LKGVWGKLFFKAGSLEQVSKTPHETAIKEICDKTSFPQYLSEATKWNIF